MKFEVDRDTLAEFPMFFLEKCEVDSPWEAMDTILKQGHLVERSGFSSTLVPYLIV